MHISAHTQIQKNIFSELLCQNIIREIEPLIEC